MEKIDHVLNTVVQPQIERGEIKRVTIFALARIPLLSYLGYRLGDKVPVSVYQKHRGLEEGWSWPDHGAEVKFKLLKHGNKDAKKVALFVSCSGGEIANVRNTTGSETAIYEISPVSTPRSRMLLTSPKTIENFRKKYHDFLSRLEVEHRNVSVVDYFLAVPTPLAVICGRDVLRGVTPKIVIHDWINDEYKPAITLS
jgi:hypothetical protein